MTDPNDEIISAVKDVVVPLTDDEIKIELLDYYYLNKKSSVMQGINALSKKNKDIADKLPKLLFELIESGQIEPVSSTATAILYSVRE